MRFSVASGTDNSLLQLIVNANVANELHNHQIELYVKPYGIEGLNPVQAGPNLTDIAPHGLTVRATYTVPANKITRIDLIDIMALRKTVAGTVGIIEVMCTLDIGGGGAIHCLRQMMLDNNVGASIQDSISPKIIMEAGDTIALRSSDLSATGTADYRMAYVLSELDA